MEGCTVGSCIPAPDTFDTSSAGVACDLPHHHQCGYGAAAVAKPLARPSSGRFDTAVLYLAKRFHWTIGVDNVDSKSVQTYAVSQPVCKMVGRCTIL